LDDARSDPSLTIVTADPSIVILFGAQLNSEIAHKTTRAIRLFAPTSLLA
jgi:hypothetical protein